MSQHDMIVSNSNGATVRGDINSGLQALASTSKGNSAPTTIYAGQMWIDDNTPSGTMWTGNIYDGAQSIPWIAIDTTNNLVILSPDGGVHGVKATVTGATIVGVLAIGALSNWTLSDDGTNPYITFDSTDTISYDRSGNALNVTVGGTVRTTLNATGVFVGSTDTDPSNNSGNNPGIALRTSGWIAAAAYQFQPGLFNRLGNDGDVITILQDGAVEGTIAVSGNTVSYGAFAGSHWSQIDGGGNPALLLGTVMSTVDALCVWRAVEFTTKATTRTIPDGTRTVEEPILDRDGKVIGTSQREVHKVREEPIPGSKKHILYDGSEAPGTEINHAFDGETYRAVVVDERNERLAMCKVSDAPADPAVYGVFSHYDDDDDLCVMALGAYVVRVAKGQTPKRGDLLDSNGDGCARVQADDLVRASTVAKVTSATVVKTHPDGSFLVPCSLMCG